MWIRTGFNADPDQWRIRIQIQGAKPMRIHADLDPGQALASLKVEFLHKK